MGSGADELQDQASILPAGTVTFLAAEVVPAGPAAHALVAATVTAAGGVPAERSAGDDRVLGVFTSAADALAAAAEVQRALRAGPAGESGGTGGNGRTGPPGSADGPAPSARIGLHTGEALLRDDRHYAGAALHRATRLRDVAHGGQTLLSSVTAELVGDALPPGATLADLGAHRLRDLSRPERVHELRHPDLPGDLPPLRSLDALANNLPIQLTSFVGRGDELAEVELLLAGERMVTITGSGGCGKTRVALQAAAELADRWPDGVWWVDLGSVTDPALVAETVAATIDVLVEPVGGPLRAMTLQLRDRRLLVCLDNCEHLLDASAEVAETLLRSCPEVSVLATSREPLALAGETVWRVPSLAGDEAVALFVERASRVRPWFTLDETNEAAVRTMCQRLDGIPLAIELAAAWLRTLTPAQIAAGLDDRFALLVRGPRGAIARHQTLAASIEWSHALLDDADRAVFRRLAGFTGGFTLDAAQAVCSDGPDPAGRGGQAGQAGRAPGVTAIGVLTSLGSLVDKSLVVMDERHGEARYRTLETIRQYALEQLREAGEEDAVADRHLDHFLAWVETAGPEFIDGDQDTWLARLETDHENLRYAMQRALALEDTERAHRLAAVLLWMWYLHGHTSEGIDLLTRAIALAPDDRSPLVPHLMSGIAAVAVAAGRFDAMIEHALRGIELAGVVGDETSRARCLMILAVAQSYIDFETSADLLAQGAEAAAASGDPFAADRIFVMQGVLTAYQDRHDEARPILREGHERCLRRGDRGFASLALNYQTVAQVVTGHLDEAERLARLAVDIAAPLGDYYDVGLTTSHLAFVKAFAGDVEGAKRLMEQIRRSVEGATQTVYVPRMSQVLGRLALLDGDFEDAVRWYRRDVIDDGPMADSLIVARALPGLANALRRLDRTDEARDQVDRAVALSTKFDVPHLLADSLEQAALLSEADDPDAAEDLHHQALALRVDHGLGLFLVDSLDGLARLAARAESRAEATRLLAASDSARADLGYPRAAVDGPAHEETLASLRAGLGDEAFAEAWDAGSDLALDDAVAYARRARGARSRPSTGWASLTPTELEVVKGVVDGLTNPEIGTRLFMSRGTVKTHLSHVYAKLDVSNRTELATIASRHQAP
jgi:predicted ATPase/DNA-binding CsgD family transcriptional regulator/class 3 adenylate cyclase